MCLGSTSISSGTPLIGGIQRHDTYGNDTIGDGYEARVVLNDWRDMYTKARLEMTPLEAATWSKEGVRAVPTGGASRRSRASTPSARGSASASTAPSSRWRFSSSAASAVYFWQTRWYLFPALYLNFAVLR